MNDRPSLFQLLDVVRTYLQDGVISATTDDQKQRHRAAIAVDVVGIIERELRMNSDHLKAEWARLNFVQNVTTLMPSDLAEASAALAERNRKLCEEITAGRYDYAPQRSALFEHLLVTTRAQLEVAGPQFLQALASEDEKRGK